MPLGVIAAYRRNSPLDVGTMIVANAGVSMPVFVLGLLLQYLFAVTLKDTWIALPSSGRLSPGLVPTPFYEQWGLGKNGVLEFISNFEMLNGLLQWNWRLVVDAGQHLILPAVAVGTIPLAIIARMTRSSVLDVLGHDYVRTARAKGLQRAAASSAATPCAAACCPVVTVIGLSLGGLFGGAILTETVFSLTGVGKTLYDSITARDYGVVQGFSLIVGIAFVARQPDHRRAVHRVRPAGACVVTTRPRRRSPGSAERPRRRAVRRRPPAAAHRRRSPSSSRWGDVVPATCCARGRAGSGSSSPRSSSGWPCSPR